MLTLVLRCKIYAWMQSIPYEGSTIESTHTKWDSNFMQNGVYNFLGCGQTMRNSWWFSVLWFHQKTAPLTNWHDELQIRRICPFVANRICALFANLIWIENCEFLTVTNHESRIVWPHSYAKRGFINLKSIKSRFW